MWWFRNGAATYNIYRNTTNNVATAVKIVSAAPYTDPNTGGYVDNVSAGTYYYWVENSGGMNKIALNTNSTGGLTVAACPGPTNGTCGSSNGQTLSSAPSTNLCNTGTASAVSGSGPWEWSCVGTGVGHTDASCEAKAAAATCDFTIAPMSSNFGSSGGVGSIGVFASAQICPWTAVSNNSWLHIISGSSGTGNGVSVYSVDSYSGSTVRTGTITIAGKIFTVTQDPPTACNFSINPTNKHFPSAGGSVDCRRKS
jgi:hypothetical protein